LSRSRVKHLMFLPFLQLRCSIPIPEAFRRGGR
jgi:hypothetical protein